MRNSLFTRLAEQGVNLIERNGYNESPMIKKIINGIKSYFGDALVGSSLERIDDEWTMLEDGLLDAIRKAGYIVENKGYFCISNIEFTANSHAQADEIKKILNNNSPQTKSEVWVSSILSDRFSIFLEQQDIKHVLVNQDCTYVVECNNDDIFGNSVPEVLFQGEWRPSRQAKKDINIPNNTTQRNQTNVPTGTQAIIEVCDRDGKKEMFVGSDKITFGRGVEATHMVNSQFTSSSHGTFSFSHNILIYSDHSKNGTYINGEKLLNGKIGLKENDVLIFGGNTKMQCSDYATITIKSIVIETNKQSSTPMTGVVKTPTIQTPTIQATPMMPICKIELNIGDKKEIHTVKAEKLPYKIGRGLDNDMIIPTDNEADNNGIKTINGVDMIINTTSREHIVITRVDDTAIEATVLGTYGITYNGKQIAKNQDVTVSLDESIILGRDTMGVQIKFFKDKTCQK